MKFLFILVRNQTYYFLFSGNPLKKYSFYRILNDMDSFYFDTIIVEVRTLNFISLVH